MKIAITGATGYLANHILHRLIEQDPINEVAVILHNNDINFYDNKITLYDNDINSLRKALHGADTVIHFGAVYKSDTSVNNVHAMSAANIQLTADIMSIASDENVRVIMPTTFSMFNNDHEYEPKTFYAATKMFAEQTSKFFDTNITFLRLPDTFGSNDNRPKLANLLVNAVNHKQQFQTQKPADFKMNIIAVEDLGDIILRIIDKPKEVVADKITYYDLFYPENEVTLSELFDVIDSKHEYLSAQNTENIPEVVKKPQLMPGYTIQYPIIERIKKEVSSYND